jgi:hypothetical protein
MLNPGRPASSRLPRTAAYLLVLVLVALTLVVEGSQPGHTHGGSSAGLYNEDCPLADLAGLHAASPLPQSSSSVGIPLVAGAPPATGDEHRQPAPAAASDSRAPPAPLA